MIALAFQSISKNQRSLNRSFEYYSGINYMSNGLSIFANFYLLTSATFLWNRRLARKINAYFLCSRLGTHNAIGTLDIISSALWPTPNAACDFVIEQQVLLTRCMRTFHRHAWSVFFQLISR